MSKMSESSRWISLISLFLVLYILTSIIWDFIVAKIMALHWRMNLPAKRNFSSVTVFFEFSLRGKLCPITQSYIKHFPCPFYGERHKLSRISALRTEEMILDWFKSEMLKFAMLSTQFLAFRKTCNAQTFRSVEDLICECFLPEPWLF